MKTRTLNYKLDKSIFYFFIIGIYLSFKYLHRLADSNELLFLFSPVSKVIQLVSGYSYSIMLDGSFGFSELNIIIDKSCSGFNLFALCFILLSCLMVQHFDKTVQHISALVIAGIVAYFFTIAVNATRILVSISLEEQIASLFSIESNIAHTLIGITNNLSFLILIYLIAENFLIKLTSHERPI